MVLTDPQKTELENKKRAERAEIVASWYFRLNGFLSIPGFIVHPDKRQGHPRTEADLIGVRFPYSAEEIAGRRMTDDALLLNLASHNRTLFVLIEVKVDLCKVNGPWSRQAEGNMQRVIRRLGFTEKGVNDVADEMYKTLRWDDNKFALQYVTIGARRNPTLQKNFKGLVQITWSEIAVFLFARFRDFPEKLPDTGRPVHAQWPDFGRSYGGAFSGLRSEKDSLSAVLRYIETGNC